MLLDGEELGKTLPPEAMGARVYVGDVHVGYLINPTYEKLINLRAKIKSGEVNEDGLQNNGF